MPLVSIVVPCYNEETTIRPLLESLYRQTIPCNQLEVVIADGMSDDQTVDQIRKFQSENPDLTVKVVTNEKRTIPSGLNRAIKAACGEYILRLDAHCIPQDDYIERTVADLAQGLGDNVGGVWEIR
ncbi:MAG: glycosyl transferase family 2, partial [Chloroflexi bacterium]|nr:glycosyl transferase family 2 [Chloroflexota bacterium]